MKSLFILNNPHKLSQCLDAMQNNDGLLLIEDAVINSHKKGCSIPVKNCYVLSADLIARGLLNAVQAHWKIIDCPEFVQLTLRYDKTVSWL